MADIILPTEPRKPSYDISRLHIALHGRPKIGKSTWASSWPDAIFLSPEAGTQYLTVTELRIKSWRHLNDAVDTLAKGGHRFKTIVVDTMDMAVAMCRDAVCEAAGEKYENEGSLSFGKGTSMIAADVERFLRKLESLPFGVVLISHTEQKVVKKKSGVEIQKAQPTYHEKVNRVLLGWVDMILYMDQDDVVGKDGKIQEVRVIRTAASAYYEAGDRTKCLPETLVVPEEGGYDAFVAALKGDSTKEKE